MSIIPECFGLWLLDFGSKPCIKTAPSIIDITTIDDEAIVNNNDTLAVEDISGLEPCNHEEAVTRLLLHCKHAYSSGKRRIIVVVTGNSSSCCPAGLFSLGTVWPWTSHALYSNTSNSIQIGSTPLLSAANLPCLYRM